MKVSLICKRFKIRVIQKWNCKVFCLSIDYVRFAEFMVCLFARRLRVSQLLLKDRLHRLR